MPETKLTHESTAVTPETPPKSTWQRRLLGIGFILLFLDVGVSAAVKGGLGNAPMVVAVVAFALLAISAIGSLIQYASSKSKHA